MSFKIHIEPGSKELNARPGETVLEAALRQGYSLSYSCRNGACGTCKGRIVSGEINYGDYDLRALTVEEKAAGLALFCQAVPLGDLVIEAREIVAARDIPIKTLPCRVARMERAADDVMVLHLKLSPGERLQFLAGQYIEILLRDGRRRGFSLANAPHDDEFLQLHIRHVPGGYFTNYVFNEMKEKAILRFRGPLGTFFLREESDRPVILVAGGTGFAPTKSIIEHTFHTGTKRSIHLYWGARAVRDLYLDKLVHSWVREHPGFHYTPVLSEPLPGDQWTGRTGYVHEAVVAEYPDLSGHDIYVCGPPAMIEAAKGLFRNSGLAEGCLYYDSFEYARDPVALNTAG